MERTASEIIETLSDFLEWASQFDDGTYVFRGVPNDEYEIQASAYRRVPEDEQNSDDKGFPTFVEINTALIREARLRGYDQKDGRPLDDLEILADLQHFKAATCLIDFTHSAQVALWFACGQDSKTSHPTNGKVFAVHKDISLRKLLRIMTKRSIENLPRPLSITRADLSRHNRNAMKTLLMITMMRSD